jgi:hypothetical protein
MEYANEPTDDIFWQRVLRARRRSGEDKLLDGPRLFDMACRIAMDGIRHQYPDADEKRVREILAERIELQRRLEEGDRFFPVPLIVDESG